MNIDNTKLKYYRDLLIFNPRLWFIVSILVLITFHHYEEQTNISLFFVPDRILGITRHTIDRILYLIPIILSAFFFGSRGGFITLSIAFLAMLPRAIFISQSPSTALLETFVIMLIGSFVPMRIDYYQRQDEQLEVVMERLETTQRRLYSKVRMSMEQGKQMALINSFSAILSRSSELEQVMKSAIDMVKEIMQVEVVLIFSLNRRTEELRIAAFEGIQRESASALDGMSLRDGFCGCVAATGKPLLIENIQNNPRLCGLPIKEEKLQTQLSVPLVARGQVIGTLCAATRSQRLFKEPEIELLSALGNLIGVAMDSSRLYQQREVATDRLKFSEKKYRQLFENAHDAIWIQDLAGEITAANNAAAELFGCTLPELIGTDIRQLLSQEGIELSREIQERLISGQDMPQPYKQKLIKKDGTEAILTLTTNLVSSNGHPDGLQFIGRDITNEVRMQENQGFYLQQITKAHEEERLRISRDLHDSTAQSLIAALHQLEDFCRADKYLPMSSLRSLWSLHEQLKDSLQEIRQLSRDLRPSILDDLGLLPAVEWLAEQLKIEQSIETNTLINGEEKRFSPEIEVTLFRIVQEALRNIAKHSGATKVQIAIDFKDKETRVVITDDGKGFSLPKSLGEFSRLGKLGIDGMQTRARLVGGTLSIQSQLGKGTTLTVTVPA